jgi:antitoxin (DNA-binding transcriptional repressor) of toxin-antitoxin stability system
MKRVTATEARKSWFRILDEVVAGEEVCVERNGRRIVLRAEEEAIESAEVPDYGRLLQVPAAEEADRWGWEWTGPGEELRPRLATADPEPDR